MALNSTMCQVSHVLADIRETYCCHKQGRNAAYHGGAENRP